ncbi:MAG: secondary thiamine-phosphate synthase enzyme YjbQ [Nanoarchaeota archaeon]|nr:secondary thiamine-phosphate synthase enzyme YjbQ [Nanoarchaeota archaeon]
MEIILKTSKRQEMIDITSKVQDIVTNSKIKNGMVYVFSQHTTASLMINEKEERLLEDIKEFLESFAPITKKYKHDDIEKRNCSPDEPLNGHSHLRSLLFKTSETIPVKNGKLNLGQWQSILFIELDGPRSNRKITVSIINSE